MKDKVLFDLLCWDKPGFMMWRCHHHRRLDFQGADCEQFEFNGLELENIDWRGSYFPGSYIKKSSFRSCDLRHTNFEYSKMDDAWFIGSDVSHSNMSNMRMYDCLFRDCRLVAVNFMFTEWGMTDLGCVDMRNADLRHIDVRLLSLLDNVILPDTDIMERIEIDEYGELLLHMNRAHVSIGCQSRSIADWMIMKRDRFYEDVSHDEDMYMFMKEHRDELYERVMALPLYPGMQEN